jgi:pimeloyl-ACP methyl ester carboxylesterase
MTTSTTSSTMSSLLVNGTRIELIERGSGAPLLFLHPGIGIDPAAPVLEGLARGRRLIAPSHPGFGASDLPSGFTTVDDLAYFYLDLLDQLDLRGTLAVGVGLGAWIAAAIAVKSYERIGRLVLANAIGIKVGDRETRDIVDIWAITADELDALAFHDPSTARRDYRNLPESAALTAARNREATARFCWSPYMHDPKLKARLHRIRVPTLFLWGTSDQILSEHYGRAYCAAIPGARFETIAGAGHYPHLEQPEEFARRALAFAEAATSRG